ncbi:hypothetical protein ACFQHV_10300 [Promicromonospora thailandica]|uniref:Uncharacterized protein n=1 Tax=Promicromonospora thailandica TaxID=765201 RepID=A0A9X2G3L9_9MICO|nr:hypothetical protein [Promicromonospora thailandica]MCP2264868.1 hypothetical protein [Promicromonospora thailandica]BFF18874.1 hypothetical protein GCM10025730_23950 [Promicromonospora thailandica]
MVALVAGIIWVLSTLANFSNTWNPLNFVLRVAAGVVTVAAAAEWLVLTVRDLRGRDATHDEAVATSAEAPADPQPERSEPAAWREQVPPPGQVPPRERGTPPDPQPRPGPASRPPDPSPVPGLPAPGLPPSAMPPSAMPPEPPSEAGPRTAPPRRPRRRSDPRPPRRPRTSGRPGLSRLRRTHGAPGENLSVVVNGGTLDVVAYLMERKVRRVTLRVGLDSESLEGLAEVLGAAPHRVFSTQEPTRGLFDRSAYTQVEGASGSGAWSVAVRTEHVEALRYVLLRAAPLG